MWPRKRTPQRISRTSVLGARENIPTEHRALSTVSTEHRALSTSMHPRLRALLLFLTFAALSQIFEPLFSWLVLVKAHVVDTSDLSWRPSLFIWFESCVTVAALVATWIVARIGRRRF